MSHASRDLWSQDTLPTQQRRFVVVFWSETVQSFVRPREDLVLFVLKVPTKNRSCIGLYGGVAVVFVDFEMPTTEEN